MILWRSLIALSLVFRLLELSFVRAVGKLPDGVVRASDAPTATVAASSNAVATLAARDPAGRCRGISWEISGRSTSITVMAAPPTSPAPFFAATPCLSHVKSTVNLREQPAFRRG